MFFMCIVHCTVKIWSSKIISFALKHIVYAISKAESGSDSDQSKVK